MLLKFICAFSIYFFIACMMNDGRLRWLWGVFWSAPPAFVVFFGKNINSVNNLYKLIWISMPLIILYNLWGTKMWNIHRTQKHSIIYLLCYVISFGAISYYFIYPQMNGYIYNFQNISDSMSSLDRFLVLLPYLIISIFAAKQLYYFLDRFFSLETTLIVINCLALNIGLFGYDNFFIKTYYFRGINNGQTYEFKTTKRTYIMLKREKSLEMKIREGCLGGMFVVKNPTPQNERKVLRMDRRIILRGFLFTVLYFGLFWYFFIYK